MIAYSLISPADRARIENKYHKTNEPFDGFRRMAYHGYDYDPATGDTDEEISKALAALKEELSGEPRAVIKARLVAYVLDHTRIDVNENDYFVGLYSWGRLPDPFTVDPWYGEAQEEAKAEVGSDYRMALGNSGTAWLGLDFDHTVPDFDSMMALGFPGLLARLETSYTQKVKNGTLTPKQEIFYLSAKTEYEAILRLLARMLAYAEGKSFSKARCIAESLRHLLAGPPRTMLDAMQMIYIYYMISESVEHYQVRSLGYGLDGTLYPFYQNDLCTGAFTQKELATFLAHFLLQFSAMGNYWGQPMFLGGTNADGSTRVNELSYLILDVYDALGLYNPKIQIKYGKSTPRDFTDRVLTMIRGGSTSFVFCNEDVMRRAMMGQGATYEAASDAIIKGCYEYACKADSIGISFNTYNALKPIVLVFHRGHDRLTGELLGTDTGSVEEMTTFAQFYEAYLAQLDAVVSRSLPCLDALERRIQNVNPTILFSVTLPKCIDTLTDAMDGGIRNVSDMLLNGLGSATDALMAVYELVFEKKSTTLGELKRALDANWVGYEKLCREALACRHKYGKGDALADSYAAAIHRRFASAFAGRRNPHGGIYEYELHSARAFLTFGAQTEATPDGRCDWEETSKNASASVGADTEGVTALIRSACTLDHSIADSGCCLDVMLHPTTVQGEGGLDILHSVLSTYMSLGGASIHFNIFGADTLRDAQAHPERYTGLQVRVCGWNVLWNHMCKEEQDAYIARACAIRE